ncbi:unnamed protein product [Schistosoma turkestanicum]|nr:unnamed protein product [Schistosoma turkestanicum]
MQHQLNSCFMPKNRIMKYIYSLFVLIILLTSIESIKTDENDDISDNKYNHSERLHHYPSKNNITYQSNNYNDVSIQRTNTKRKENNPNGNYEQNRKSIRSRHDGYARRNGKIRSCGNSVRGGSYSESTYFTLHAGTDKYGRRHDDSQFQSRGMSKGYRGSTFINAFNLFGYIKSKQYHIKTTQSKRRDKYMNKRVLYPDNSNVKMKQKMKRPELSVYKGESRSLGKNITHRYRNSSNASLPLSSR